MKKYKVIRIIGVMLLVVGAALIILQIMEGGKVSHSNDRRGWGVHWPGQRLVWLVT